MITVKNFQPKNIRSIHCLGIGGFGLSALAGLLREKGFTVTGSDKATSPMLEQLQKKGMNIIVSPRQNEPLPKNTQLLIYSEAIPQNNVQRKEAEQKKIPTMSYFAALGLLSGQYEQVIAVAGTNGKTTTTAMLTEIMIAAGFEPTAIIGSPLNSSGKNYVAGSDKLFLVEACEYRRNFLHLAPTGIIITNIAEDHLDYYRDINDIAAAFQDFIHKLPKDGILIVNKDDKNSQTKLSHTCHSASFSLGRHPADLTASHMESRQQMTHFIVTEKQTGSEIPLQLSVPGSFNMANALAAAAMARHLGAEWEQIKSALRGFQGTWRRFQRLPDYQGALVFSDYAHHPAALTAALEAARQFYPDKKIVAIFQPHQHNRTKKLFGEFVTALRAADVIIVPEIYDVVGREEDQDQNISSKHIAEKLRQHRKEAHYTRDLEETGIIIQQTAAAGQLLLFLGAGDIYTLAESLQKL